MSEEVKVEESIEIEAEEVSSVDNEGISESEDGVDREDSAAVKSLARLDDRAEEETLFEDAAVEDAAVEDETSESTDKADSELVTFEAHALDVEGFSDEICVLEGSNPEGSNPEDSNAEDMNTECSSVEGGGAQSVEPEPKAAAEENPLEESANEALGIVPVLQALFMSSSDPLDVETLSQVCEVDKDCIGEALKILTAQLESDKYGISLVAVAKGFQFRTKAQYGRYIRALRQESPRKLSPAALETLAVVAYRQPVVKHDIDGLRGVDVMPTLKTLLERGLIQIVGHRETVGHPSLYGTTDEFLRIFGLNSLQDLPTVNELTHMKSEPGEEAAGFKNPLANMVQGDPEHVTAATAI